VKTNGLLRLPTPRRHQPQLGPTVRAHHTAAIMTPKKTFAEPGPEAWLGQVHVCRKLSPQGNEHRDGGTPWAPTSATIPG
jgi:hypothetical protein